MNSSSNNSIVFQMILIGILTIINAFFASAEMAIVSLNKNRLKILSDEGNDKAILLEKLMEEPSRFLATIQVGITLAGFFASASAATGLSTRFSSYLSKYNIPYSSKISIIIITIILSYFTLVFGELYPKRIALQKSEAIAMFAVKPIVYISKITIPFVKLLSNSTNLLVRISGIQIENLEEKVSKEEIRSLIEVGQEHGVINETEKEMIESIFEFDNTIAEEIMTPRTEVFLIDINSPSEKILEELLEEKYSRIPVYEEDVDNIIGILYMKDFIIEASIHGFDKVDIRSILRTPYFVPVTKNIDNLFKQLQKSNNHMAILIDEYGGFAGIVTIEDLIEEVMGNIFDEYDDAEPYIKKIDTDTYIVNGLLSINEVNDYFSINLQSEHSDTIGGFVVDLIDNIPSEVNETVEYGGIIFKVEEVKEKRIEKVRIIIKGEI
ncbi:hemolysin family protein [Clostridium sp. UBA4548]|uniref:hemolysin family protein n=1 Tax=Clostridium sp. UBA4548 TaxID=1946361 RepID=UPI0025C69B2A|nr:hemolysin family protein [Clostridium sp. UBA4548]